MREGKYPNLKMKHVILILSFLLLLIAVIGGTIAYLQTTSGSVTNTFAPAEVKITPDETKTDTQKSNITFKNDGTVPVYIRATLVIYWTDTIKGVEQTIAPPAADLVNIGSVQSGWFQEGDIYYYSEPVAPGDSTGVMLEPITVTLPDGSTAQCHIDVHAEAIQADGMGATSAQDAWAKAAKSDS